MVRSFLWNGRMPYGTSSSWKRHDHARCPSSNTAIAGFARAAEPGVGHQPQDRCEVAQARERRRLEDRADRASFDGSVRGRRGGDRGVQTAYTSALGRLPLRPAAFDTPPHAICAASVPATAWHLALA